MSWDPQVEKRVHPFGEAGVRSSLEEVCKRAAAGASEILGDPKHLARVRTWSGKQIKEARDRGEPAHRPGDRARILLKAVQTKKIWVPDPIGIEYIPAAHLMACDGDKHDDGTPCVVSEDCDGVVTLLAACFMSVGLYTMIVGHSYSRDKNIGHVLCKVYFDRKWHYADPSPLGNGKYMDLGECAPPTRERYYSMPTIKVVCDGTTCDRQTLDPHELGFVEEGHFVGVNGVTVYELPPEAPGPRVEWLGAPVVEWLGAEENESYKADDALSKAIIAKKGDTSPEAFKEYTKVVAAMGATAACAAFGASAASPFCGVVAGVVIGWIVDKIPVAKGSDMYDAVAQTWKSWTGPNLKWAQEAMLSVKTYYVMRDEAIKEAEALGKTKQWAEQYLANHGLEREPTPGRWAPISARYLHPLACTSDPCLPVKDIPGIDSSYLKECAAAGMDCRTYLMLTYGPWPPIAGKNEPVDWGLIAWDEISFQRQSQKKYGNCNMPAWLPVGGQSQIKVSCPSGLPPTEWARERLIRLDKVKAKMLFDAQYPSTSKATTGTVTKVAIGLGVVAAAAYAAQQLGWLSFLKRSA